MHPTRTVLPVLRQLRQLPRSASGIAARNLFTIVQQGYEGWRLSLGRNPVKLEPGLSMAIPVYHTVQHVDMREMAVSIPNLPGYTSDNVPVTCSGSLLFRIVDSYRACFEVNDVQANIKNTGMSAMRSVLGSFTYDQVISDRNEINKRLNTVIGSSISNWGVECSRFEIQTFQPANREVERQLELQMEAERNRRKQLLDTEAQINVAEGNKQRVILESEGNLAAKTNEADATYKMVFREAEARQQQAIMEAKAVAQQVEELARSIAADKQNITPPERQQALNTLVELKRLEQLKAIASSHSNTTYFFGDKAALGKDRDVYDVDYAEQIRKSVDMKRRGSEATLM